MTEAKDKTILVVDDEPNVLEYLSMILEDSGFNVLTAKDGQEALEITKREKPDFISLDLIMPRKSGYHLLKELKRDRELSRIPVLVVTAHARDELGQGDLEDLLANRIMSGPGTHLEKPVDPRSYVRIIRQALGLADDVTEERVGLRDQLNKQLRNASPEQLREALEFLCKTNDKE